MKPHIRRQYGLWCCGIRSLCGPSPRFVAPLGYGYTASEAFRDWKAQTEVAASTATT